MADRFWVGGTGNWDAATTTNWSASSGGAGGSSVPSSSDTVTFDASSGGGTVTVTANTANVQSITFGDFTGTFDSNGFTVNTAGTFNISGSGTRTITLGSSAVNVGAWNSGTTTNLTFNANTSTITQSGASSSFSGGGLTFNNVVITNTATATMTGANTFANLSRTVAAGNKTAALTLGANITVTGTLTVTGASATERIIVKSSAVSTNRTITAAIISLTNVDFQSITAAGAASPFSGTSIGDATGNINITPTASTTRYWVGGTGNWDSTGEWSTSSGGATGASVPLCHDNVIFDANSFSAGSQTVTANQPRLGYDINFTGVTNTPTILFTSSAGFTNSVYGDLTLVSGMNITPGALRTLDFSGSDAQTFTTGGIASIDIHIQTTKSTSSTLTLSGTFIQVTSTRTFRLLEGNFDANNNNLTVGTFSTFGSSTLTMGSGTWTVLGSSIAWSFSSLDTLFSNTSTIKFTDTTNAALTFTGGNETYNNVWFSRGASTGSITINTSNTFNDFKDDGSAAHSILFSAGTTQHVTTFSVSGTSGNLISIDSTTTGTHALVKDGGGTISRDYLNIQHSVASPTNTWYAGANSTDNQAVATAGSGWIFTVPPTSTNNMFLVM